MNSKKKKMFAVALVAATVLVGCSGEAQEDYRIYVIRPAINNNAILDDEALPAECRDESVMKVLCARGEYEPASFLVETDKPLEQVMVKVGPLTGSAGVLAPETVDVRIAKKFLVSPCFGKVAIPFTLVHDPGMMKIIDHTPKYYRELKEESWKEPGGHSLQEYKAGHSKINQLVKELIDTDTLQPGDIEDFRQFWLTVHVPADAKSGTYHGDVTITAANAGATTLTLEVTVPKFDLLAPKFEYSIYYPGRLSNDMSKDSIAKWDPWARASDQQYLAECRNMVAHGCTNPCIWDGPGRDKGGKLDFTKLSRYLDLREKAGMGPGGPLYMFDGAGMFVGLRELTPEERQRNVEVTRQTVAWARARGYSDVYFMGLDGASGERLRACRDSYASVHEGGGKIWGAYEADPDERVVTEFFDIAGDLLDVSVVLHPGHIIVDAHQQWQVDSRDYLLHRQRMVTYDPELLMTPHIQKMIEGVHKNGFKVFFQMDPVPGNPLPDLHRRNRGLGMWKTGIDGTMTRAYVDHHAPRTIHFDDQQIKDSGVNIASFNFVLRGPEGPLDTLAWEGYREGYDDARYLATLQDAIAKAKAGGKHAGLVARTERWLGDITVNADLDAWRWEMARRTEQLLR